MFSAHKGTYLEINGVTGQKRDEKQQYKYSIPNLFFLCYSSKLVIIVYGLFFMTDPFYDHTQSFDSLLLSKD